MNLRADHYSRAAITITLEPLYLCEQLPFTLGNVVKYLLRAPYKGCEDSDYEKAAFYLHRYLQSIEYRDGVNPWLDGRVPDMLEMYLQRNTLLQQIFDLDGTVRSSSLYAIMRREAAAAAASAKPKEDRDR